MSFSYNFFFVLTKFVFKVSVVVQVIKNHIFLSAAKSNDPLHIDYVPNVFKFTKIQAKRTQESLKRYERAQKGQRRQNVKTSEIFTAPCISNDSAMELGRQNDKGTRIVGLFSFFIICRNYFFY